MPSLFVFSCKKTLSLSPIRRLTHRENAMITRCDWVPPGNELYIDYHDKEWGVPVYDDRLLFEFLILEGAQAGLSRLTVLRKRENYRRAFDNSTSSKSRPMTKQSSPS